MNFLTFTNPSNAGRPVVVNAADIAAIEDRGAFRVLHLRGSSVIVAETIEAITTAATNATTPSTGTTPTP
jgi:hypothetical protein